MVGNVTKNHTISQRGRQVVAEGDLEPCLNLLPEVVNVRVLCGHPVCLPPLGEPDVGSWSRNRPVPRPSPRGGGAGRGDGSVSAGGGGEGGVWPPGGGVVAVGLVVVTLVVIGVVVVVDWWVVVYLRNGCVGRGRRGRFRRRSRPDRSYPVHVRHDGFFLHRLELRRMLGD